MQSFPTAHVPLPELRLDEDATPYSTQFEDVYFSRAGGVAETTYVFLQGNRLPERWKDRPQFTIGELGFGTGLNFLVAWQAFLASSSPKQHLHFISVEKYPFTAEMLRALYEQAIAHSTLAAADVAQLAALLAAYPLRLPGWHTIHLERCTLTLGFGDALALLTSLDAKIDAWFIDGFSPAKNPHMWQPEIFAQLARLSASGASFATFTAAGEVKRQLVAHGFAVEKIKGFAHKREMLIGEKLEASIPAKLSSDQPILILGAGIAGATAARALAECGKQVLVLERAKVASNASGNPAGVLYPPLTKFYIPSTAWHFTGYSLMLRQLARWKEAGLRFSFASPGMLRLPRPEQHATDFVSLNMDPTIMRYVTQAEASRLAELEVASDGWWFPQGTWLAPAELCRALLQHPNIDLREESPVATLTQDSSLWRITLANGETLTAKQVIVATAHETPQLLPDYPLKLGISAGQVSVLPSESLPIPRCIISHRGYIIPMDKQLLLGATYDRSEHAGSITQANHIENLSHAQAAMPGWPVPDRAVSGRTSFRATAPDRLPYVGELAPGLYTSIGHGSRGLISAPLAAEILTAMITDSPIPLEKPLRDAVHPLRYQK